MNAIRAMIFFIAVLAFSPAQKALAREQLESITKWASESQESFVLSLSTIQTYQDVCGFVIDPDRLYELMRENFGATIGAADTTKIVFSIYTWSKLGRTVMELKSADEKTRVCNDALADFGRNGTKIKGILYKDTNQLLRSR